MKNTISKAVVLSFLVHYVILLVFLSFETVPAKSKSIPILIVQSPVSNDEIQADDSVPTGTESDEGANAQASLEAPARPGPVTGPVATPSLPPAVEKKQREPEQPVHSPIAEATGSIAPDKQQLVVDTVARENRPESSEKVVTTTTRQIEKTRQNEVPGLAARQAETIPVSTPDRTMLEEKFRHWAEDFGAIMETGSTVDWVHGDQAWSASFSQVAAEDDLSMGHVVVEISKEDGGARFNTKMRMKNLSFSNYAQFVNRWNPDVQLHDDVSVGRFHSNSQVHLAYSRNIKPVFFGKVTTSHRKINTSESTGKFLRHEIFPGGLETGVKRIDMPKRLSLFDGVTSAENIHFQVFDEDTRIRFYPDGSYGWSPVKSTSPEELVDLNGEAAFLVGAKKAALHVRGVVNGKILVYSRDDIVIEDDLVYAEHPDDVPESDDYLGLVSDRSIEIAGPKLTGSGDLLINAAMYAGRSFKVRRYSSRNDGTMSIFGSLAAGSMSATEPRYATHIRFDSRLENFRPPRFPVTDRYEVETWDGHWEVQGESDEPDERHVDGVLN